MTVGDAVEPYGFEAAVFPHEAGPGVARRRPDLARHPYYALRRGERRPDWARHLDPPVRRGMRNQLAELTK